MTIQNSTAEDIDEIFRLYKLATEYQKSKPNSAIWPEFSTALIQTEIQENRQWKIIIDNKIACVWAIAFSDPQIWQERNSDPAIYIHRIATDPNFRGRNLVGEIVNWSKEYAPKNQKKFVRMDTVGENQGLIDYYTHCGFDFLGLSKLSDTAGLPAHYEDATVSLFEIELPE